MTPVPLLRRFALPCIAFAAFSLSPAMAQDSDADAGTSSNTLTITLDTGKPASAPSRATAARKTASSSTARKPARGAQPLASRNGVRSLRQQPMEAPKISARLGCIITDQVDLRVGIEPTSRLLSRAPKGTYVAIVAETDDAWGILMLNNTIGWTPKSGVELMDYETQVPVGSAQDPTEPPAEANAYTEQMEGIDSRIQGVLREAFTYLGVPYVWGGNTRNGLDCSAFVRSCFRTQGIDLPRHSGDQTSQGRAILSGSDLRVGDRLYFDCSTRHAGIDHTGIYLGKGLFIHASGGHGRVVVESLFKPLYIKGLVAIRRDFE